MSVEGTDRIAFRFARSEIAALLKLMNAASLPEIELIAAEPDEHTESSLVEGGVVMPCGEHTFVDGTVAVVLQNVLESRRSLCADSEKGRLALYRGAQMCVLVEESGPALVTLEPVQDLKAAQRPFFKAVGTLGVESKLTLRQEGEEMQGGTGTLSEMYARLEGE